jgi:hypothetical protein
MIYIACPEKFATGGTELLHQLYYKLRSYTNNVKIFYYDYSDTGSPVNERFEKYKIEYVNEIKDEDKSILIVPEILTELLNNYKKINKSIWWLSVDNYLNSVGDITNKFNSIKKKVKLIYRRKYFNKIVNFNDNSILHLYQSYYAKDFLEKKKVKKMQYLSDYIGSNFLVEKAEFSEMNRENRVLYNPQKGIEFTKKLMSIDTTIEFTPLINMSQTQIIELCKKSKVYIDFGNHPGKDRFPREAAHLGCIIITGKRGSANFHEDVMIPEKYKFIDKDSNIPQIISEIKNIFKNYNDIEQEFDEYRKMIKNEEKIFEEDVARIWNEFLEKFDK